jgi:hypothetical protein
MQTPSGAIRPIERTRTVDRLKHARLDEVERLVTGMRSFAETAISLPQGM